MSNSKPLIPSIHDIQKYLKEETLLPVYFLFGDDSYTIDQTIKTIQKETDKFISSDFDKEVINGEKGYSVNQVVDLASSFPFGSGKRIIIVKNFEKLSDRKSIETYLAGPADFTILVLANYGKVTEFLKEPYKTMLKKNYLFEAKELRGDEWVHWIVRQAKKEKLIISLDNAQILVDTVGEEKGLLEMQMTKFYDFLGEGKEITKEIIERLTSSTKEFTIFNLQDSLGKGDKQKSLKIAYNLIDSGVEPVFIISMLTKFITTLAQILDLMKKRTPDNEAAKEANVSYYYYINCKKAKFFLADSRLLQAARALLNADITLKTTSIDSKTLIAVLITEMTTQENI
ncbi:MAG: DNA polymerase III subunit delta [Bacteroidetes bacterium]|nr:DNA polymerase III subunit delta [Bacteroidota bacterium]